jgi:hypothetical protein
LIVTPTFVSRVDATLYGERLHDQGSSRGRDGREVRHPDRNAEALALEPDPNAAFKHWDEYWRKVHGPKFARDELGQFL